MGWLNPLAHNASASFMFLQINVRIANLNGHVESLYLAGTQVASVLYLRAAASHTMSHQASQGQQEERLVQTRAVPQWLPFSDCRWPQEQVKTLHILEALHCWGTIEGMEEGDSCLLSSGDPTWFQFLGGKRIGGVEKQTDGQEQLWLCIAGPGNSFAM